MSLDPRLRPLRDLIVKVAVHELREEMQRRVIVTQDKRTGTGVAPTTPASGNSSVQVSVGRTDRENNDTRTRRTRRN